MTTHTNTDTPTTPPADLDPWADAFQGAAEEAVNDKAQRRKDRIRNCGRPMNWSNELVKEWKKAYQFCKDWTCDYCNLRRGSDEKAMMERARADYDNVYAIFDLPEQQWPKLARLFISISITKNMYRRLPQDNNLVTVFFVGQPTGRIVEIAEIVPVSKGSTIIGDADSIDDDTSTAQYTWFDLARKRPGKRTSGTLGAKIEPIPTGPEKTSVRIIAVCGDGVTANEDAKAMKQAEAVTKDIIPQDKEHLEELIESVADAYESALKRLGYKTYRVAMYRKMDLNGLTSIHDQDDSRIDNNSIDHSVRMAQEFLYPRETAEI